MIVGHSAHEIYNLEFVEFDIDCAQDYSFLRDNEDYCLIGDGTCIVCTLMKQQTNFKDFEIYILDDEFKDQAEGPFKLSTFLSQLEIEK